MNNDIVLEGLIQAINDQIDIMKKQSERLTRRYHERSAVLEYRIQSLKDQREEYERRIQKGR